MFFSKKNQAPVIKTNSYNEPLDRLVNGELPWGWATHHKDFTEPLQNQCRYFINIWIESRKLPVKEQYAALKSFVLFLNDAKNLASSKGECYFKWFQDIIADDEYISKRQAELDALIK